MHLLYLLMQVDDALIEKLSRLSMLSFTDDEKIEIRSELEKMIGFMDKIRELELEDVESLPHIQANVLREDIPSGMLSKEEALKNAPAKNENFFLVPKVIKKPGK